MSIKLYTCTITYGNFYYKNEINMTKFKRLFAGRFSIISLECVLLLSPILTMIIMLFSYRLYTDTDTQISALTRPKINLNHCKWRRGRFQLSHYHGGTVTVIRGEVVNTLILKLAILRRGSV